MATDDRERGDGMVPSPVFATTHWSVVLTTREQGSLAADAALEKLCRLYWYPIYAYVRRKGRRVEEAQDLTQEFFTKVLEKKYLSRADPSRGKFRTFLLACLTSFLNDEWDKAQCTKRGGGCTIISRDDVSWAEENYRTEAVETLTPEKLYQQRCITVLLNQALENLENACRADGQQRFFDELKIYLMDEEGPSQEEAATRLEITIYALRSRLKRLRKDFRDLVRTEVANTVAHPEDVQAELREMFAAWS